MATATEMTLTEAATATGRARSTIWKAYKSGKISARKDDKGNLYFEPAELFRDFTPVSKTETETPQIEQAETTKARRETLSETLKTLLQDADDSDLVAMLAEMDEAARSLLLAREVQKLRHEARRLESDRDEWKKQASELTLRMLPAPAVARRGFWSWFVRHPANPEPENKTATA